MNSKIYSALIAFLMCCSAVFGASALEKTPLNIVYDGEYISGAADVYTISESPFFKLDEIAAVLKASVDYKPISNKATLTLGTNKIDFQMNGTAVFFNRSKKTFSMPSVLQKRTLYIPPEILTSPEFKDIADAEISYTPDTHLFTLEHRSNISAVRYYTKPDDTQILIELDEKLPYTIEKSTNAIMVSFARGQIKNDSVTARNGAIKDIVFATQGREAIFKINLEQAPRLVTTKMIKEPLALSVNIAHTVPVDISQASVITADIATDSTTAPANAAPQAAEVLTSPESVNIKQESFDDAQIIDVSDTSADTDPAFMALPVNVVTPEIIADDSYAIVEEKDTAKPPALATYKKLDKKKLIVIDAGHGGEDPGAVGARGTKEKEINLAIAENLKKLFDNDKNFEAVLTRKDDKFLPLVERTNIANEKKADMFISVHCNSNFKREVSGFEVYFLSEKTSDSVAEATAMLENSVIELEGKPSAKRALLQELLWSMALNEYINESSEIASFITGEAPGRLKIKNNGVKQAGFYVLRGTQMPAVLVETGFLSNYAEEAKLNTKKFQASAADAIYEGVKKYYVSKEKKDTAAKQ
jgi:N-acetylmuramoyl-L-alanine amidase